MPDFYTRMHAASVTDTLGAGLMLLGMMVQAGLSLVTVKLVIVGLLVFFSSPAATHALAKAGMTRGIEPLLGAAGAHAIEALIVNVLLAMMAVVAVVIALQGNLFAVVILGSVYSFLMATALVALDAVDVAMTEAAVGAGISTVLLLGALYLVRGEEQKPRVAAVDPARRQRRDGGDARVRHVRTAGILRSRPRRSTRTWRRATSTTPRARRACRTS